MDTPNQGIGTSFASLGIETAKNKEVLFFRLPINKEELLYG